MKITEISLKRPVFATVTILALVVLGLFSYINLNVDEYPNVEIPVVAVTVTYPGASPEQVETKVTQKIEDTVSVIPGVDHITSSVQEGVSRTVIQFTMETNPATAAQDVRDKLGRIQGSLPDDADTPVISRFDPSDTAVASVALTGNVSPRELTIIANDVIAKRLEAIDGVAAVNVQGGIEREIKINMDSDKLAAYNLTISEITNSLRNENMDTPGGMVTDGKRQTNLRSVGSLSSPQQFLDLPIAQRNGVQLFVHNIATVEDSTKEVTSISKLNDSTAVGLDVMKQSGSNTVQVVDNVKKELASIQKELPSGVQMTLVRDNSKNINDSIHDVLFNLVLGGLLAVAIVFLFLGNWRSTIIAAIAIPTSIITSFLAMKALNFTLNTMSLLALSLAVGLLIDDAIVVIENIVRHLEMGKSKYDAAAEGTAEIGLAVTATTLTLVAVFLPVGMMTGIVGQFFKQFGITVAVSVLVSLFVAFTLTPMLSSKYLSRGSAGESTSKFARIWTGWNHKFDYWTGRYGDFLKYALGHRGKVIIITVGLFFGSLTLIPLLGSTFVPDADSGEITVSATVDPGMTPQAVGEIADHISQIIRGVPQVTMTYSTADINNINILAELTPKSNRKVSDNQIIAELRQKLNDIPGVQISVSKKSGMSGGKPFSLVIQGTSLDKLAEISDQVAQLVASTPGAVDVSSSYTAGSPDVQIAVNRDKASDLGVSTANIANTLQTMFNGTVVTQFRDETDSYDVRLILAPGDRKNLTDVNNIFLAGSNRGQDGQTVMVPMSQVTSTVYATSPSLIKRYDRQEQITISANLNGTTLGQFNTDLNAKLAQVKLPDGYKFVKTGQSQQMTDAFTGIIMALAMAVLFIFFVLAAQFESYIDPFAIMLSLPLAIIGAILGLLVAKSQLSMMSLIGIIMLMGLVTKNAILLVDFAKQRMEQGHERNQALVDAAIVRMRPILMTTTAMIFGMIPLALGIGPGAEARAPMAHAIIGGLITSTILTLVVVPVVYTLLDDVRKGKITVKASLPSVLGWLKRKKGSLKEEVR
ncbi:efflux RND transporter permease subunit [Sporomusa acidovorans]|uniref:Multidrug resistance protein MdtC n=1 Tax=Sporomusa acidovorans (strain ATCC 49682 / DSM 3132 / Mol) TaxID=1123286 RepID=A0ABZ3JAX4_SPOA4|nr:efflux RND transporter permease subunit [Sporomusa acidovorans]OZC21625.1 multidrug resistance protein MdtC [Sporomusa acidovorans DSM 3132]SDD62198.1 hydrophobic/amphiphilic exporter-1, HAE1 family [Sporomusa acidovorans]